MNAQVRECWGEQPFVTEFAGETYGKALKALAKYVREQEKAGKSVFVHAITSLFDDEADEGSKCKVYSYLTFQ